MELPPPGRAAFLLDVDGTLLDFAPTPLAVVVPPELPGILRSLKSRVRGALGMISGRPVEQVAELFGDIPEAIAGEHGGAIRHNPGAEIERADLRPPPPEWLISAERLAREQPGVLLEHKARGFVLHYRGAPEAGSELRAVLEGLLGADTRFALMPAHLAWEVKPRGADKGTALAGLMAREPFVERIPVFVGDDVTDLDAARAAQAMGGVGLMVVDSFGSPAGVRAWLGKLAEHGW